ncbi:MAG: RNA polymerase sigma factor RpoH [Alphaproteobacteria bacterium]|nr:RNA polymerase sigma factor RpoH [Alphaproteobacteria bacterium]
MNIGKEQEKVHNKIPPFLVAPYQSDEDNAQDDAIHGELLIDDAPLLEDVTPEDFAVDVPDASSRHNVVKSSSKNLPATIGNLPDLTGTGSFIQYMNSISQYPILEPEEERALALALREKQDLQAAHKLVTSHLRLVAKIAFGYKGYGLPVTDLVSEGNVGLLQAVKNYDPDKGARLATYAMWWIKAAIHEYVLKSWSLVKIGTSSAQKKLFFNLRSLKQKIKKYEDGYLTEDEAKQIAGELDVSVKDVQQMEMRMIGSDQSLNSKIKQGDDGQDEWLTALPDERINQEDMLIALDERSYQHKIVAHALQMLNQRERDILKARRLQEKPVTLEELSKVYGISRERIRQLEAQAMDNFKKVIMQNMPNHVDEMKFLTQ